MRRAITGMVLGIGCLSLHAANAAQPYKRDPTADGRLIGSIEGTNLFRSYCASCHGSDAKGAGPMAQALKNPLPDLTQIAVRNRGIFPGLKVQGIISGESEMSSHGTRQMPVWGQLHRGCWPH